MTRFVRTNASWVLGAAQLVCDKQTRFGALESEAERSLFKAKGVFACLNTGLAPKMERATSFESRPDLVFLRSICAPTKLRLGVGQASSWHRARRPSQSG